MQRCSLKNSTTLLVLTFLVLFCLYYQEKILKINSKSLKFAKKKPNFDELLQKQIPGPQFRNLSYIHSAFRVSNDEIRVTFIKAYRVNLPVYYKYGTKRGQVRFECVLPTCLDAFSKPCNMIGYFGIIREKFDVEFDFIEFSTNRTSDNYETFIQIKDSRIKKDHVYSHQLGVCVQSVYLHADYVLFIQFFEYWLSQGATKFYIYRESYTSEIQRILEFYSKTSSADIEMVDWSLLPTYPKVAILDNPNAYIYRLEMMLSIYDCIHRSRATVKFVAQTDLDELIYIKSGQTVVNFMEDFSKKEPFFASVSFQSQRIFFDEHAFGNIKSPNEVNFTNFEKIDLENQVFDRPYYSKLIYRPERVNRVHSHRQFPSEKIPGSTNRYKNKLINSTDGVVLHMRRSADTFKWKKTNKSKLLKNLAENWNKNYQNRINRYDFGEEIWKDIGVAVVREVDACRKQVYKEKDKKCHNVLVCEESLSIMHQQSFIHANNSWIFV